MKSLSFVLPFPPSVNGLYHNVTRRSGKGTARVKGKRYKEWEVEAAIKMREQHPGITPFNPFFVRNPVHVSYRFTRPNRQLRDLSNLFKAPDDFMVMWGILSDDSIIQSLAAEFMDFDEKKDGWVEIIVTEKGAEAP